MRRLFLSADILGAKSCLKLHHHVKITEEHKLDLLVWKGLLTAPDSYYQPFMETKAWNAQQTDMYLMHLAISVWDLVLIVAVNGCLVNGIQNFARNITLL